MMELGLLRPQWLLALPLLVAAMLMLRRRRARLGDWEQVIDPQMLAAMRMLGRVEQTGGGTRGVLALAAAALVAVALAGPATERRDAAVYRNLDGVVFVLDASPSATGSADWTELQTLGRFGVAALQSRPAALIVYAGDAYLATDMTADTIQLGLTMSLVGADTVPDPGSRPELGLALADRVLQEAEVLAGDVLLISDGEGIGPATLSAAAEIAARGARLSVVVPQVSPQIETLARTGNGRVFAAGQSEDLSEFLAVSARERLEKQDYPLLFWADWGRFLLLPALLLMLPMFARRTG
ncbi:VWA domain-containing protein [Sedimentitalea sp. XS_ASV28]|uniref:VWA domain-containing protein n=1 Tax=Sedimentitalea sp. XS_ASV28 TaxID=3241296 RepID=UPI003510E322